MDLSTIIADAGVLVVNSFTDAQKVRWLNQIRRMLQRKVKFPNAIDRQALVADVSLYDLPSDCQPDRIERVVVVDSSDEEQQYDLVTPDETLRDYVATVVTDNKLWIYPTPTVTEGYLWLYYTPSEADWVSTNLTVEPSTPEDYHQYYVFRLGEYMAKARQDVDLANNLKADADEVLAQMVREFDSDGVTSFQMAQNW